MSELKAPHAIVQTLHYTCMSGYSVQCVDIIIWCHAFWACYAMAMAISKFGALERLEKAR